MTLCPKNLTFGSRRTKWAPSRWAGEAGSDEGAIWYPTFPCKKRRSPSCRLNEVFLLPRWASRSPPHPSPSVTASPPRGSLWVVLPYTKKASQIRVRRWAPKQPPYRNTAPHHAKTSEWQRAGHKKRGGGGIPPRLFASGLSLEKAWIPRPGPGGNPPRRF